MAARKKTVSRKRAPARKSAGAPKGQDAITLLKADHKLVLGLFQQFEKARGDARKKALAGKICEELKIHTRIEEEVLYPAARGALREAKQELIDEADVEHAGAKDLIAQIEASGPGAELYDAKVKVLGEYIDHHVKEEHEEMFPELRKTKLDLKDIGARLEARKKELQKGGAAVRAGGLTGSRPRPRRSSDAASEGFIAGLAREIGLRR